ncbi:MAG: TDT family transporter [Acidimicrobiales bacterium]
MDTETQHSPAQHRRGIVARSCQALGLFPELEHPSLVVRHLTPNWFASIMGTGIVANAGALLPFHSRLLTDFATAVWMFAASMLALLCVLWLVQIVAYPAGAKAPFLDSRAAQFYGAPPMAFLTVGTGFLLLGGPVIGAHASVAADFVLWSIGTVLGIASALVVPLLMFTRHDFHPRETYATWLMPVVPSVVAAGAGAALIPHLPAGQLRLDALALDYALFGASVVLAGIIVVLLYSRLVYHKLCDSDMIPTLWIVLGPIGTSIGAAILLGKASAGVWPHFAPALTVIGLVYGLMLWGFGAIWALIAGLLTARAARNRLPFALTWWAFTFPIGVFTTGTYALAAETGSVALGYVGAGLYAVLIGAWLLVAARTMAGSVRGHLFHPAPRAGGGVAAAAATPVGVEPARVEPAALVMAGAPPAETA